MTSKNDNNRFLGRQDGSVEPLNPSFPLKYVTVVQHLTIRILGIVDS